MLQLRGETGFDLVEKFDTPLPHLVFVTGYDKHAVRAFECNALDYLLKPVLPDRLAETLNRIRGVQPRAAASRPGMDDLVFLKASAVARFVPWREIHHITAERNYTMVHLESGARLLVHRPLGAWLELAPHGEWLQVHRSVLVRRDTVREISVIDRDRRELVLTGGVCVPFGEKFRATVVAALGME